MNQNPVIYFLSDMHAGESRSQVRCQMEDLKILNNVLAPIKEKHIHCQLTKNSASQLDTHAHLCVFRPELRGVGEAPVSC